MFFSLNNSKPHLYRILTHKHTHTHFGYENEKVVPEWLGGQENKLRKTKGCGIIHTLTIMVSFQD